MGTFIDSTHMKLIFMIPGSNEQLQQQLEYTLIKPDCHSWWISKMQSDTLGLIFLSLVPG